MSKKQGKKPNKREVSPNKNGEVVQPNQWQASEKQMNWLKYYMDPKETETYANSYQSAIKAGYSEAYASRIMTPSMALQWVQGARNIMRRMNTEHLSKALEDIALSQMAKDSDRIAAIKLLGTDQGMFVQKQITAHVGLEEALAELE